MTKGKMKSLNGYVIIDGGIAPYVYGPGKFRTYRVEQNARAIGFIRRGYGVKNGNPFWIEPMLLNSPMNRSRYKTFNEALDGLVLAFTNA